MKLCYGEVISKDGMLRNDVVVKTKLPVSKKGLAIGSGLIAAGVYALVRSAFIKGSDSHGDAYEKALQKIGAISPSIEIDSAKERKAWS